MKHLKRPLSLVLSLLLLLGLLSAGAGASGYTDAGEIAHTDAVALLTALKVVQPKADGSFGPDEPVTRAGMARLICTVLGGLFGPVEEASPAPYGDTAGHPDEPYISYCAAHGIAAGRGDGSFDPDGAATVSEAVKMTLVALGIDPGLFEFTGRDWQINVDTKANQVGLYRDFPQLNTSLPITRDEAALLLCNALQAYVLEPDGTDGAATLLKRRYAVAYYDGELKSAQDGVLILAAAEKDHREITPVELTFADRGGDYAALVGAQVRIFTYDSTPESGGLAVEVLFVLDGT